MAEGKTYEISDLTEKQQTLLRLLIEGKSKAEAYREAYPGSKLANPTRQVEKMINNEGGKFPKFSQVYERARAETIKRAEEALEESVMKKTELLAMLSRIARAQEMDTGMIGLGQGEQQLIEMAPSMHDRIKALELLGKHLGIFEERVNLNVSENPFAGLSTEELRTIAQAMEDA